MGPKLIPLIVISEYDALGTTLGEWVDNINITIINHICVPIDNNNNHVFVPIDNCDTVTERCVIASDPVVPVACSAANPCTGVNQQCLQGECRVMNAENRSIISLK